MLISYAQNFEDVMLWRALGQVKAGFPKGFYIDVGAQDPVVDSVSLAFYEHGWRGIHVEPAPRYAEMLRQRRPDETVVQAVVGTGRSACKFFEIPDTGLSTADSKIARQHRSARFVVKEISVPRTTLAAIFESCAGREIHWMKIDVEGSERDVLKSWHSSKARPWVVVVESTLPLTQVESHEDWEPLLLRRGYAHVYSDGLNRYYVSGEHAELGDAFRTGPNLFDDFALSGTSSAPFCSLLTANYKAELQQKTQELDARRAGEQALAERERQFASKLEDARQLALRMAQMAAERERACAAKIQDAQQTALNMSQTAAERVQRLSDALEASRAELSSQIRHLSVRERELGEQIIEGQKERERMTHAFAQREEKSGASATRARMEMDRLSRALSARDEALNTLKQVVEDELANAAQALSSSSGPAFEASPIDRYRLRDLTRFNDRAFIDAAYQALLCRAPDPTGLPFYLKRLRAGTAKQRILGEIWHSREGRSVGAKVSGLAVAYALQRASALPVIGGGVRLLLFLASLPSLSRDSGILASDYAQASDRLRSCASSATATLQKAERVLGAQAGGEAPHIRKHAGSAAGDAAQGQPPSILSQSVELGARSPDDAIDELAVLLSQSQEARDLSSR